MAWSRLPVAGAAAHAAQRQPNSVLAAPPARAALARRGAMRWRPRPCRFHSRGHRPLDPGLRANARSISTLEPTERKHGRNTAVSADSTQHRYRACSFSPPVLAFGVGAPARSTTRAGPSHHRAVLARRRGRRPTRALRRNWAALTQQVSIENSRRRRTIARDGGQGRAGGYTLLLPRRPRDQRNAVPEAVVQPIDDFVASAARPRTGVPSCTPRCRRSVAKLLAYARTSRAS